MVPATMVALLAVLLLILSSFLTPASGYTYRAEEEEDGRRSTSSSSSSHAHGSRAGMFMLGRSRRAFRTEAGEVRIVSGNRRWKGDQSSMHIAFVSMEPNSLLIPQYIDANLVLFVRRGEVEVGWIHKDELVEKKLKRGDVNVIPAGSSFYAVNANSERLQMVCCIDTSHSLSNNYHQSFFIGGGLNPTSVLAGFDIDTLTTAFNLTSEQLRPMMRRQSGGPIVHFSRDQQQQRDWKEEEELTTSPWTSIQNFLKSLLGKNDVMQESTSGSETYNLYNSEPRFKNDYGWSTAIDEHDYSALANCGIGVYLVNLNAGSMMAPHFNPIATEYGVVLSGSGRIQVVFPNGTAAMNAEVAEGDVFRIPRYYPVCQVASRDGPMEFFGFTTSAKRNHPQFLAGASSVLRSMMGRELAAAFGVSEEELRRAVEAQRESVILPASSNLEEEEVVERKEETVVEELLVMKRRGFFA
ncbi:vicilin-like seed storage protein [Canna indica]|uniref:Vicilin-like seed storage protein n=1 Tax=Canna indica TaxID=4628 RepID=A0AAQ3K0M0_9LILI|nr:vicilin-like seed storage protein [Canna indica]